MQIRLLHKLRRGTVLDLVPADARRLIDDGMAEEVAPAPAPPPEPPKAAPIEPEAAILPPAPERATAPRARGRG